MSVVCCDCCSRSLYSSFRILTEARKKAVPEDIPSYRTGMEDIRLDRFMKELRLNACCRKVIMCQQVMDVKFYGERSSW